MSSQVMSQLVPMRKFEPTGDDLMYTGYTGDPDDGNSDPEDYEDPYPHADDVDDVEIQDSEYAQQSDAQKSATDPDNDAEHLSTNAEITKSGAVTVEDELDTENNGNESKNREEAENREQDQHYLENQEYRRAMEAAIASKKKQPRGWKAGAVEQPQDTEETTDTAIDILRALKLYHQIVAPAGDVNFFASTGKFAEDTKNSLNCSSAPAREQVDWKPEYLLRVDGEPSHKANSLIPLVQLILANEPGTWAVEQLIDNGSMVKKCVEGSINPGQSSIPATKSENIHTIKEEEDTEGERDL